MAPSIEQLAQRPVVGVQHLAQEPPQQRPAHLAEVDDGRVGEGGIERRADQVERRGRVRDAAQHRGEEHRRPGVGVHHAVGAIDGDEGQRLAGPSEVLTRIAAPVQLVWGQHDPFFPVDRARAMVETFPDARLHVVPGAKLFVHEEHPAEVAGALLPVLAGGRHEG